MTKISACAALLLIAACAEAPPDPNARAPIYLTLDELSEASVCLSHKRRPPEDLGDTPDATDDQIRAEAHRAAAAVLKKYGKQRSAAREVQIACTYVRAGDCDAVGSPL